MHPVYRGMDSFPHQRNQMPYTQHYYPSFEAIPPQMKGDTARSPITYETWPYGGNYSLSVPMGCHGCCNHSYFPGYSAFKPPYPHYPPPSPFHCHGAYPSFPESYPVHYVPPSHYTMQQPTYEYEKNVPRDHHCCGCPNHTCDKKEDRRVKIEEQEPDFEKKSSNSLVPVEFKIHPYPTVCIPPEYMKNREQRNPTEPERDGYAHETRAHENLKLSEQEPGLWNGWFPFDINSLGSLKHGGDRERTHNQPNQDSNQFPFPIFWMPYKPDEEETRDHEEAHTGRESAEKSPSNSKANALPFPGRENSMCQPRASEEICGSEVGSKTMVKKSTNLKTIPVKQLEAHEEKRMPEEAEGKASGITVEDIEERKGKKSSENGSKRESSSPPKTSKLPLVCLRVDPLPSRKNGNGSSRSPTPGHKGNSQELFGESSKSTSPRGKENTQHNMQSSSCNLNKTKEIKPNERERKVVKVMDGITRQDGEGCKIQTQPQALVSLPIDSREEVSTSQSISKAGTDDPVRNLKENKEATHSDEKKSREAIKSTGATIKSQSSDNQSQTQKDNGADKEEKENPEEAKKAKRNNLSEAEAAVVIQSVYRGFESRKGEPLKKLKQIAKLKEHVTEIRGRIEVLESSPDISSHNRQIVVIGETIMSLLLKLDTIQGLHPIVRDFRKSVAKELVSLQEKLDSLATRKSEVSIDNLVGALSMNTRENVSIQGEQKEAEVGHRDSIAQSTHDNKPRSVEPCQVQVAHLTESSSGSQNVEISELKLVEKELCEGSKDNITSSPQESSIDSGKAEADPMNKPKDGLNVERLGDGQVMILKLPVEALPLVAKENVDSVVEVAVPSCPGDQSVKLPVMSDQELPSEEFQRNEQIETGHEVLPGEVESLSAIDVTSTDGEVADTNQVEQPLDAFKEETTAAGLVDVSGKERDFMLHEDAGVRQEQLLLQAQGEIVHHIDDRVETSNIEDEVSLKENEALEFIVQTPGEEGSNMNDVSGTSEPEESQPELSLTQSEIHDGEASKPEEPHAELSLAENETHGGEASKPEVPQPELSPLGTKILDGEASELAELRPELSPAQNEIHWGEQKEDGGIPNHEDNCWEEKEVLVEETKECKTESRIIIGEQNQELVEDRHEHKMLQSVAGNGKVVEQPCGSETAKGEALIATQFASPGAERPEGEGEVFPVSPTASQISLGSDIWSASDRKLFEENEKLREVMEKLVEAGKEQLTAISSLSGRVKDLENKLARKKKLRTRRFKAGSPCINPSNGSLKGRVRGIAV